MKIKYHRLDLQSLLENLGLTFFIIFKFSFDIQSSKSCGHQRHLIWPKTNKFSLPRRLRPLRILIVDQYDHSMFKYWAAHLCAWILHLRKLCWHCSVFQNLPLPPTLSIPESQQSTLLHTSASDLLAHFKRKLSRNHFCIIITIRWYRNWSGLR